MNRLSVLLCWAAAAAVGIFHLLSVSGGVASPGKEDASIRKPPAYHGAGATAASSPDPDCSGPKCHAGASHRKQAHSAAFLNFHEEVVSCAGCHRKNAERGWKAVKGGDKDKLRLEHVPVPDGKDPHEWNGEPIPCKGCHSAEGRKALADAGMQGLGEGFESPIALRMIEGGGRKWIPDGMR